MDKNKKIIIAVCAVVIIAIICVVAFFMIKYNGQNKETDSSKSKLSQVYEKMNEKLMYTFTATLNDKNSKTVKRKNDKARIDLSLDGEKSTDIIKDGNTYLVISEDEKVYKYQNNDIELTELLIDIKETIESQNPQKSKEEIDGKKYECEEYKGISDFLLTKKAEDEENLSTKFYFKGNDLVYIKTKNNKEEELLKINISYDDISENEFEIPSEYEVL